jgi:hypothetical protein
VPGGEERPVSYTQTERALMLISDAHARIHTRNACLAVVRIAELLVLVLAGVSARFTKGP